MGHIRDSYSLHSTYGAKGLVESMISGGAKALSILTQPYLFKGHPENFIHVRKQVEIPLLMKDIMISKTQIDAAKKNGRRLFFTDSGII